MKSKNKWILLALLQSIAFSFLLSGCSSMGQALEASPSLANALGVADIPMSYLKKHYVTDNDHFMKVNGYDIHYREVGQGPTIVLCHGIYSSLQTWDGWINDLKGSYRVIALDMPGYGLTGGPKNIDDFTEQNMVNTFAKFVDHLGLKHFDLVGNSMGGFVAATYAANYPDRVDRLILLDPFGYPQPTPWLLSLATFPPVEFMGRYILPPVVVTMNLRWTYGDPRRITDKNAYRYVRMSQREGAKAIYVKTLNIVKAQAHTDKPLPFYRIKAPTLLMWGAKDPWVPRKIAQKWLNDVPDSKLIVYPGVGHIPMEEIPETTVADAEAFLSGGFKGLNKEQKAVKGQSSENDNTDNESPASDAPFLKGTPASGPAPDKNANPAPGYTPVQ